MVVQMCIRDSCYDGEKALELLGVECYDLVLLDLNLPKKDGMTVLRTLDVYKRQALPGTETELWIKTANGCKIHVFEERPDTLPPKAALLLNFHGGSVWVEESSDKGTTIAVELPAGAKNDSSGADIP